MFIPTVSLARNMQDHNKDISAVLGVKIKNNSALNSVLTEFAIAIDNVPKGFSKQITETIKKVDQEAIDFNTGKYSHRLFFHWGFNVDPRKSSALAERINLASKSYAGREAAYLTIINEQGKRNKKLKKSVERLGSLSPDQANALATIIYNTHILGDYIKGKDDTIKPLLPIQNLAGDLINASRKIGCMDIKLINKFKRSIDQANRTPGKPEEKAVAIFEVLKKEMPTIINNTDRVKKALH